MPLFSMKIVLFMIFRGMAVQWHSRGQRFDPAYLHQGKSCNQYGYRTFRISWPYHNSRLVWNVVWNGDKNCGDIGVERIRGTLIYWTVLMFSAGRRG